jgi:exonuclease III
MRVVTWNMGFWQYRPHHDDAWTYLRQELRPDLALLQEVREVPLVDDEARVYSVAWRGWGTAIVARGLRLDPIEIAVDLGGRKGYVVGARCHGDDGDSFVAVSVHAPILGGRVFPYLDRIFEAVEDATKGERFIVGGDLNSARLAETLWPGYGHGPFWERIARGPFVDCYQRFHAEERRTVFHPRGTSPLQDDHLFMSRDLVPGLRSCEVVEDVVTRRVSDHVPLFAVVESAPNAGR